MVSYIRSGFEGLRLTYYSRELAMGSLTSNLDDLFNRELHGADDVDIVECLSG